MTYILAQYVKATDVLTLINTAGVNLISVCHDGTYFNVFYKLEPGVHYDS